MGSTSSFSRTHRHLILLLPLLLLLSPMRYSAEGRPLLKVPKEGLGEGTMMEGAMIGSRPPTCQGRCSSCGHCEAVQVPAIPQSRGDDTNYKPLSWKCKCGGIILNP